jgi:hypothetical protein
MNKNCSFDILGFSIKYTNNRFFNIFLQDKEAVKYIKKIDELQGYERIEMVEITDTD